MADEELTVPDVAHRLGVAARTVYELVRRGAVKASQTSGQLRISERDLDAFLQAARIRPGDLPPGTDTHPSNR